MDTDFGNVFAGKRVPVTGHTGFKGAWLSGWLLMPGAKVTGSPLPSPTSPSLHGQLGLSGRLREIVGDIRDPVVLRATVDACRPDFVFHPAAQPLGRAPHADPAWRSAEGVAATVSWYRGAHEDPAPADIASTTRAQISDLTGPAREASLARAARSAT